ncbi:MAG: TraV family lipoprotein [Nitrospinae bacterium]|nr:TraV family lipoprotein [Nitrospinota bacterium]
MIAVIALLPMVGCVLPGQWIEQKDLPCSGPQGWKCQSINQTYKDALSEGKDGKSEATGTDHQDAGNIGRNEWRHLYKPPAPEWSIASPRDDDALNEGKPLRDPGEVLRIKIYDYVDKKGVLFRGRYAYIEVKKPRWNLGAGIGGKDGKGSVK